jgi:hypothetical protein
MLFLMSDGRRFIRDVSACDEEAAWAQPEMIERRLSREHARLLFSSRFISEQLIGVANAIGIPLELTTERVTPHLITAAKLARVVTGARIDFDGVSRAGAVTVTSRPPT